VPTEVALPRLARSGRRRRRLWIYRRRPRQVQLPERFCAGWVIYLCPSTRHDPHRGDEPPTGPYMSAGSDSRLRPWTQNRSLIVPKSDQLSAAIHTNLVAAISATDELAHRDAVADVNLDDEKD